MTTRLITAGELLQYPTGVDWDTLAEDAASTDPRQTIEQGFLIDSVSSWAAEYCHQPLGLHATTQTEQARVERAAMFGFKVKVDDDGNLHFWASTLPVTALNTAQWSYLTGGLAWQPITPGNPLPWQNGAFWSLWGDYPHQRHIELFDQDYSSLRHTASIVQVNYTSGWANAILSGGPYAAGPVEVTVDSTLGMTAAAGQVGNRLYVFDGQLSEWVTVSQVNDATHFTATFANAHDPSSAPGEISASAVPQEIKLAVIHGCAALAKVRGAQSYQMKTENVGMVSRHGGQEELISLAEYYLEPYVVRF